MLLLLLLLLLPRIILPGGQRKPLRVYRRADGQSVAEVWPCNMIPAFFPNFVGEVWIQPGQAASQGEVYRHKAEGALPGPGSVALVLGEWGRGGQAVAALAAASSRSGSSSSSSRGGVARPGVLTLVEQQLVQKQQLLQVQVRYENAGAWAKLDGLAAASG
jgi:hypothetical protein